MPICGPWCSRHALFHLPGILVRTGHSWPVTGWQGGEGASQCVWQLCSSSSGATGEHRSSLSKGCPGGGIQATGHRRLGGGIVGRDGCLLSSWRHREPRAAGPESPKVGLGQEECRSLSPPELCSLSGGEQRVPPWASPPFFLWHVALCSMWRAELPTTHKTLTSGQRAGLFCSEALVVGGSLLGSPSGRGGALP